MAGLVRRSDERQKNKFFLVSILLFVLLGGALVWTDEKQLSSKLITLPKPSNFVRRSRQRDNKRVPIGEGVRRKAGIFTTHSYCRMTRWLWTEGRKNIPGTKLVDFECFEKLQKPERLLHNSTEQLQDATQLRNWDTVFVPHSAIETFVERILPNLTASIVVISGQTRQAPPANEKAIQNLLHHPKIIRWFCQNLSIYGGSNPRHSKISPFPCEFSDLMPNERSTRFQAYPNVIEMAWSTRSGTWAINTNHTRAYFSEA